MILQWIYRVAWIVVAGLLVAGAFTPMFTFTSFYFFDDTFSLLSGIFHLLNEGEPLLFLLVFTFSILVPVYKMAMLSVLIYVPGLSGERRKQFLGHLFLLGKWSMLDVFVVALLVVTIRLGALADVSVHAGLYLFSAGVITSMLLTHWVSLNGKRAE